MISRDEFIVILKKMTGFGKFSRLDLIHANEYIESQGLEKLSVRELKDIYLGENVERESIKSNINKLLRDYEQSNLN